MGAPTLVILIHSIDMGMLKAQEWMDMLAELAVCKNI